MAERQVAEAAVAHELADLAELAVKIKVRHRLLEGELEDLADVFALPSEVGELGRVAGAPAVVAREISVGHKCHLELDTPGAGAGFAAAARGIEGKASGGVAANLGLGDTGEEGADEVEDPEVGRGSGARGFADRGLVYLDHLFKNLSAAEVFKRKTWGPRLEA